MNYRNTLIAAAAAVVVPFAGTALAADHDKMAKSGATFDALDTNRDGRISRAEASADANIVFARADTNGDGYLDNMEFAKAQKAKSGAPSESDPTSPQPQSSSPYPNDASGQQLEPVSPQDATTPPTDTETPRQ